MDIKNQIYNLFDDVIHIKNVDLINVKIDKRSYKKILIYCIGNVTIKDWKYIKINNVNPLYPILTLLSPEGWGRRGHFCPRQI